MTAHSLDIGALGRRAGYILFTDGPEQPAATARETCILLDMLADAEYRADKAEVQAASERAWGEGVAAWRDYVNGLDPRLGHPRRDTPINPYSITEKEKEV